MKTCFISHLLQNLLPSRFVPILNWSADGAGTWEEGEHFPLLGVRMAWREAVAQLWNMRLPGWKVGSEVPRDGFTCGNMLEIVGQ